MFFKSLLLLLVSLSLHAQNLSLYDLGFMVSQKTGKSVVFSKDVDQSVKIVFSPTNEIDPLALLRSACRVNNLSFKSEKTFYYISALAVQDSSKEYNHDLKDDGIPLKDLSWGHNTLQTDKRSVRVVSDGRTIYDNFLGDMNSTQNVQTDENLSFQSLDLKYIRPDDIKDLLSFSGFKFSIVKNSKTIVFKVPLSKLDLFSELVDKIELIDVVRDQVTLKITVFESTQNDLFDLGFGTSISSDFNVSSRPHSLLSGSLVSLFYSSLHASQIDGNTSVTHNPVYVVADGEQLDFKAVLNMPFLDENFAIVNTNGTNTSRKYKRIPVGFQVLIMPTIVGENVYLDFNLKFESVVSAGDFPTTSERSIKNKFTVKKGDLILIAGISKESFSYSVDGVPVLKDVPLVGSVLSRTQKNNTNETYNIAIEVMKCLN